MATTCSPIPPTQTGPQVWNRSAASSQSDWTVDLTASEIATLSTLGDAAISASPTAASSCLLDTAAIDAIAAEQSTSPLATKLKELSVTQLLHGRGFLILRSLPIDEWGPAKSAAVFLLIGRCLGPLRQQNAAGHLLGHVVDLGMSSSDPNTRVYQTHERQTFHADSCDVVGLLCLRPSKEGGDSAVVSVGAIYNAMLERAPDLLRLLLLPIATDRRGEVPAGALPYYLIPVFNWFEGRLSVMYQRQYIDSAQRFCGAREDGAAGGAPVLTPQHVAALDLFDSLTNDPAFQVTMRLDRGDLQFVHNHDLLHDRSAFVDYP